VHGQMNNNELFRIVADALALAPQDKAAAPKSKKK